MADTKIADELRKAAEKIREVAGKASAGPWRAVPYVYGPPEEGWGEPSDGEVYAEQHAVVMHMPHEGGGANIPDAEHIALWDPVVAELVAKLLGDEADDMNRTASESIYGENAVRFAYDVAGDIAPILLLARAINADQPLLSVEGKDTKHDH